MKNTNTSLKNLILKTSMAKLDLRKKALNKHETKLDLRKNKHGSKLNLKKSMLIKKHV